MNRFTDLERGRAVSRALGLDLREVPPPGPAGAGSGTEELPTLVGTAALPPRLRGTHGGIHAGALLALADSTAGPANGLAVLPRWVVSTNLTLRTLRCAQAGPLRVTARVLRRGRRSAVAGFEVHDDGDGRADPAPLVAVGRLTSAALEPEGGPPPLARPLHLPASSAGSRESWTTLIGTRADSGTVVLPVTDDVRNPWGIVHGGATAALVDAAALDAAARDGAGPSCFTADVALYFLAPGRVGPLRASAAVVGRRPDGRLTDVRIRDEGAGDRPVAVATVTVREA